MDIGQVALLVGCTSLAYAAFFGVLWLCAKTPKKHFLVMFTSYKFKGEQRREYMEAVNAGLPTKDQILIWESKLNERPGTDLAHIISFQEIGVSK